MNEITCKCGWKGTEDDLVCDVIHKEAGRTVWCCPHCNTVFWNGKFLDVTAKELNAETEEDFEQQVNDALTNWGGRGDL